MASVCVVDSERFSFKGGLLASHGPCHQQVAISSFIVCLCYWKLPCQRPWPSEGSPHLETEWGKVWRYASSYQSGSLWWGALTPGLPAELTGGASLACVTDQLLLSNPAPSFFFFFFLQVLIPNRHLATQTPLLHLLLEKPTCDSKDVGMEQLKCSIIVVWIIT